MNGSPAFARIQESGRWKVDSAVLTVSEVAGRLRCSKGHVHNLINGKVRGTFTLPALRIGRRRMVLKTSLEEWIKANEECYDPIIARH
jgi:excisionase family DNA binding protein